ncbi:hypothetical protein BLA29_004070 [Euroglyphus maynei]|uniref:Uncharacterized protein n=1 Tax=Euroglyphus maynei TaxID=6958 RepID=A0A1Y3B1Q6_EURMA|nr:hypothetical protein BLA29_004070 [Euroglyphus maynei]
MQTFPVSQHFVSETLKKSTDFMPNFNDVTNEFGHKNDYNQWSRCLLLQLENAIANGDHQRAAVLAKELAFKKCKL